MAEKSLNKNKVKEQPLLPEIPPRGAEPVPAEESDIIRSDVDLSPEREEMKAEETDCRVYIGLNIRGRVQYGAVFSSAQEARQVLAAELEVWPMLAGLLVSLEELSSARAEVKTPGTARYVMAAQVRAGLTNH